jgi:hypothetical protein
LPLVTPSGFSIGIILKTKEFLRFSASFVLERRYSIIPSNMKEELDSPGWTLPVITIPFFYL